MRKVKLTDAILKKLVGDRTEGEIINAKGEIVGLFWPTDDGKWIRTIVYDHAKSLFTKKELNCRPRKNAKTYKLKDILKELKEKYGE